MFNGLGNYVVTASRNGGRQMQVRSNMGGFSTAAPFGSTAGGGMSTFFSAKNTELPMLEGLVNYDDPRIMRAMYEDIYLNDPIAGSTVDMMSTIAFGDFSLTGIPNGDMMRTYLKSCERCRVKTALPRASVDYFVDGDTLSILGYDASARIFHSLMPIPMNWTMIKEVHLHGVQPLIDVKFPEHLKKILDNDEDPRVPALKKLYPKMVLQAIIEGQVARLTQDSTIYIPRHTKASHGRSVSLFRRLMPTYIVNKALTKGTIEGAFRRQKGIMHIIAGGEDWEPTNEQLQQIADNFKKADADPVGPTIATRPDIQVTELNSGDAFWKVSDSSEWISAMTMRALGVSEAFLSGDSTYSNSENALTVFIQNVRAHRDYFTRAFFYERFFPYLAVANNFRRGGRFQSTGRIKDKYPLIDSPEYEQEMAQAYGQRVFREENGNFIAISDSSRIEIEGHNLDEYHIPNVVWHNNLRPEADQAYMELLDSLTQKGVPIPIRMMTSAGGVSLPDLLNGIDEDVDMRKKLRKYRDKIRSIDSDIQQQMMQSDQEDAEAAGGQPDWMGGEGGPSQAFIQALGKLANREWDPEDSAMLFDGDGRRKRLSSRELKERNEKFNRSLAKAAAEQSRQHNWKIKNGLLPGPDGKYRGK